MTPTKIAALVTGGLVVAVTAFIVVLFLIKWLWAWTIPDLFPGAVEQGLIVRHLSWQTAAKIALFVAVLSALSRGQIHNRSHNK